MQCNLNRDPSLRNRDEKSSDQFSNPQASESGLALIRRFEGCVLHPYRCPAGDWTIGYGHRITEEEVVLYQSGIQSAQAEDWLSSDLGLAISSAKRLTNIGLTENELGALASFIFNLGAAAYQRSTLRRAIARREAAEIERQWMRWVWAGGRKLPGLAARRGAELALFQTGQRRNGCTKP